jgi:hypothetical protein
MVLFCYTKIVNGINAIIYPFSYIYIYIVVLEIDKYLELFNYIVKMAHLFIIYDIKICKIIF